MTIWMMATTSDQEHTNHASEAKVPGSRPQNIPDCGQLIPLETLHHRRDVAGMSMVITIQCRGSMNNTSYLVEDRLSVILEKYIAW